KKFQNIMRIIVSPSNENILLTATNSGFNYFAGEKPNSYIFRSTDGGANWSEVYSSLHSIQHIISNPLNFNTQYATINSIGVIKSKDGGLTWEDASDGIGVVKRMEIAIAPTDTSRLYISAETNDYAELYISENTGETWFATTDESGTNINWLGYQGWYDNTIAVNPYSEDTVFVGGINLWQLNMVDGTDTSSSEQITDINFENTESFLSLYIPIDKYENYAIPTNAVANDFVSVEVRFGDSLSQKAHRFTYASSFNYPYHDYIEVPFEVWDTDNNIQLMASIRDHDEDSTWNPKNQAEAIDGLSREYIFIHSIEYSDSADSNIARTGGIEEKGIFFIWPESPSGVTFSPDSLPYSKIQIMYEKLITKRIHTTNVTDGYGEYGGSDKGVHVDHHNIVLIPTDTSAKKFRMLNANDGGVAYSDDKGETFIQPLTGYNTTQFYGVDKQNGTDKYIGGMQDNGTWHSPTNSDSTSAWENCFGGDGFACVWKYNDGDKILASSQYNGIRKSIDGGEIWGYSTSGISDNGSDAPFFTKLAKSKQNPDLVFAVGKSGVWRSENFGSDWELIEMPDSWYIKNNTQIKISLVNPNIVWTGTNMLTDYPLYVSTDAGFNFTTTQVYSEITMGRISGFATHPTKDSIAYALFSFADAPKILRTTDLGNSWEDISGFNPINSTSSNGFPNVAVYSLLVMPYNTDIIWAGTDIGIFESTDNGNSWNYLNSKLPAVGIYEMLIVNDEIVVGTHGRGVWSVSIPELAGYEPPIAIFVPILSEVGQSVKGDLGIKCDLRSLYDSTEVIIDNQKYSTVINSNITDTSIIIPYSVTNSTEIELYLNSYKDGKIYKSQTIETTIMPIAEPRITFITDFSSDSGYFGGNGFEILDSVGNFDDGAIHSFHPYLNNVNSIFTLRIPIIVSIENANITYKDIAAVQPYSGDSNPGDAKFYDFVIVEGSKNGAEWESLIEGYDANFWDPAWRNVYFSGNAGPKLFKLHTINLYDKFSAGDTILIRFRLYADYYDNGWGWVIDDLKIQENASAVVEQIPTQFSLSQNYPNPFNNSTVIHYELPEKAKVKLVIYDILGRKITTLIDKDKKAGIYDYQWQINRNLSSGIYFYKLIVNGEKTTYQQVKKMIFVK
ncbi:MAG: T9SS type A sorting domain-containing protein, partial [Candidatus Marinimicrobia bacterium]|nr:T9SS type A sorting domain-containing protein [Candidatus Neomarinimicrobiota bacterium]